MYVKIFDFGGSDARMSGAMNIFHIVQMLLLYLCIDMRIEKIKSVYIRTLFSFCLDMRVPLLVNFFFFQIYFNRLQSIYRTYGVNQKR